MGKAPKLLVILTDLDWPEITKLAEQGHTVLQMGEQWTPMAADDADIILSPRAHRMDESIRKHFPEAIREARRIKYGVKGDE